MKFQINKSTLDLIVSKIRYVNTKTAATPILNSVFVTASADGTLGFVCSNLDETIMVFEKESEQNGIKIEKNGESVFPLEVLNAVKKLKNGSIDFEMNKDCTQVIVRQKKTKLTFPAFDSKEYPKIATEETPTGMYQMTHKEFSEIVSTTAYAAADPKKETGRPVLAGVNISLSNTADNKVAYSVVATEAHHLAKIESLEPLNEANTNVVTVPAQSLQNLVKSFDSDSIVGICTFPSQIAFNCGNVYVYIRYLQGNYPDTKRLIPSEDRLTKYVVLKEEIVDALELMKAMRNANESDASQNFVFTAEKDVLTINTYVTGGTTSSLRQEIPLITNTPFEKFEIVFNVAFALDALKTIHTDKVSFEMSGPLHPLLVKNVYEAGTENLENHATQLILPVRTY